MNYKLFTVPTFNFCTKRAGPIATQLPGHGCIDDFITECSFDSQATWIMDGLGLFFDMFSMCVCTTGQWQTSSQLVQELNICIVYIVYGIVYSLSGYCLWSLV